jgi:hypothetical protein
MDVTGRKKAERVLCGETIYSIVSEWEAAGMRPPVAEHWSCPTLAQVLRSPRLAGLREWRPDHGQPRHQQPEYAQPHPAPRGLASANAVGLATVTATTR